MKRAVGIAWILKAVSAATVLLNMAGIVTAQQQPPVVTHPTTSRAQGTPRTGSSPYGSAAAAQTSMKVAAGTIAGYVYWDMSSAQYKLSSPCQGLTVNVSTISKSGGQVLTTTSNFTSMGPLTDPSSPGAPRYMLCSYSFHQIPVGEYLRVTAAVNAAAFLKAVSVQNPPDFEIFGGNCNNTPQSTLSFILTGGEMVCGNNAFNINLKLYGSGSLSGIQPARSGPLLQNGSGTSTSAGALTLSGSPSGGATLPGRTQNLGNGNGGGTTSSGGTLQLSGQQQNATGSTLLPSPRAASSPAPSNPGPGGARPVLPAAFTGGVKVVAGKKVTNALATNSSIIAVFRQQKQAGTLSPGHTMASGSMSRIVAERSNTRVPAVSAYIPSNLLTPQENAWCQQREAQGLDPQILRIAGKQNGQGVVYSPDPQANPYTIVGCGFGNTTGQASMSYYCPLIQLKVQINPEQHLNIQTWNDHQIVASLDPNTSGLPDCDNVKVHLSAQKQQTGAAGTGSFCARRQTIQLPSIPLSQTSLYQQGSPYFLSPVSNYYGLNGTVAVMRQGLPGPVAGQDQFTLKMAPGWVVESTQTDLLVSNTAANVTSNPASVNGNTITVTYPVVSYSSGNTTSYYSIYGLKVWVTGPVGLTP